MKHIPKHLTQRLFATATALLVVPALCAQTTWISPFGADFLDDNNWSDDAPTAGVNAIFDNDVIGIITASGDASFGQLLFAIENSANPLVLDFTGRTLTGSGIFQAGDESEVEIIGATYSGYSTLRSQNSAQLTLTGGTYNGTGILRVQNSASLTLTNSAVVNADGDSRMTATSTLTVEDGSILNINVDGVDTDDNRWGGSGTTATVTGNGSQINIVHDELRLGLNTHNSTIEVLDGGALSVATHLRIGDGSGTNNNVLVSGSGSELTVGSNLRFRGSDGELRIEGGANVDISGSLLMIDQAGASGNLVHVSGADTNLTVGGEISMGGSGSTGNTIHITDNAIVEFGNFSLGSADTSVNKLLIVSNGAVLQRDGVGANNLNAGNGEIRLDGGIIDVANIQSNEGALLTGQGTINGRVRGLSSSGALLASPGLGASGFGILNVNGEWDNEFIDITLKLGDLSSGSAIAGDNYDQILAEDFISGGSLLIDLTQYLAPETGLVSLRLLGWDDFSGDPGDLSISFSSFDPTLGSPQFMGDGLYLTAIPEPHTWGLIFGMVTAILVFIKRRYRA